ARGLVFQYQSDEAVTWTAHPFLRERFRELLGCPAERVFDTVAQALGAGLETRPDTKPSDSTTLDAIRAPNRGHASGRAGAGGVRALLVWVRPPAKGRS